MKINKLVYSTLLSLSLSLGISSFAHAETAQQPSDKQIDTQKTDDTKVEKDDEDKENETKGKSKIGGRNLSAFSRKAYTTGTAVGGYFDTIFYAPSGSATYFDQHHLILQASSLFNERIFFNTEVEFEHGGIINHETNDGELKIEQAFLDYKIQDWLVFRGGSLLIPVGRLNVRHDSDFRTTTARPLFSKTIVPTTWTETGVGFYGTAAPNDEMEFNYELYLTQGLLGDISDGPGLEETAPSLSKDNNSGKALSTRVSLSPFIGLDFGLGGYYATFDEKDQKALGMVVADFDYTIGHFELLGEGGFNVFSSPVDLKDKDGKVTGSLNGPMWGYYLEGHYNFFPEFMRLSFLGKEFNNPSFTIFTRIDQVDTDMSKLNENDRTQLCIGFNYRPITTVAFKFEYQINIENEAILKGDPSKEKPNNQFIASIAAGF